MREKIERLRIRLLYEQSFLSQAMGFLNVGIFYYATMELPNRDEISLWVAAGIALSAARVGIKYWFKTNYIDRDRAFPTRRWEYVFCASAFLGGLYWALPGIWLVDRDFVAYQTFIGFLLAGNTAGAAVAYCSSIPAVLSFLLPALVPYAVNLALGTDVFHYSMGMLVTLYCTMIIVLSVRVNRYIVSSIKLRFEKDDLMSELRTSQSKLIYSDKMSALGNMAGGIAHEINTPLAAINLNMDVLAHEARKGSVDSAFADKVATQVNATIFRISKIISSLRSFSQETSAFELIPVRTLIQDTLDLCQARYKADGLAIVVDPIPEDLVIFANAPQVSQMLLNLIDNAADAVRGLPGPWVKIEAQASGGIVRLSVIDNGRGIPVENREKIMQPFFTTKKVGEGTGLGLSIAHGIVEAHGGNLELDTKSPYTRFVASFPEPPAILRKSS